MSTRIYRINHGTAHDLLIRKGHGTVHLLVHVHPQAGDVPHVVFVGTIFLYDVGSERPVVLVILMEYHESKFTSQASRLPSGFQVVWHLCLYDSCCFAPPPTWWHTCSTQQPGYLCPSSGPSIGVHQDVSLLLFTCIACTVALLLQERLLLSLLPPPRIFSGWKRGLECCQPGKGRQDPSMRVFSQQDGGGRGCARTRRETSVRVLDGTSTLAWDGSRRTHAWRAFRRSRVDVPSAATPAVLRSTLQGHFDPLFPRKGIHPAARLGYSTSTLEAPTKHRLTSKRPSTATGPLRES